jgi:putative protease
LDEIAAIRAKTNTALEIEGFCHGAVCVSYSGRCLLSSYMTGREGNRGGCAQPCRWKYTLTEEQRPDLPFTIEGDLNGTYIMNAKDLCMLE